MKISDAVFTVAFSLLILLIFVGVANTPCSESIFCPYGGK
jgi:hypothetical protein